MPYCRACGAEAPPGADFCPKCGAQIDYKYSLVLAGWGDRVVAYLIDTILLGVLISVIFPFPWGMALGMNWSVPFTSIGSRSLFYFIYWTILEGLYGQSLGKMVMKIEVVHTDGGPIDYGRSAFQAIGKAFLLPIDLILGWFLSPELEQRYFNKLSSTVVVKKRG